MRLQPLQSSAFWVIPVCFLVNHICLYLICCNRGVLSNIGYILQRKKKSERVEHESSHSSGVKNVTSCAFFSNNWCNPPCPFFSFSPSLFLSFFFLSLSLFLFFPFIKWILHFIEHKDVKKSIWAIPNVDVQSLYCRLY